MTHPPSVPAYLDEEQTRLRDMGIHLALHCRDDVEWYRERMLREVRMAYRRMSEEDRSKPGKAVAEYPGVISRFMNGINRSINETASRLAAIQKAIEDGLIVIDEVKEKNIKIATELLVVVRGCLDLLGKYFLALCISLIEEYRNEVHEPVLRQCVATRMHELADMMGPCDHLIKISGRVDDVITGIALPEVPEGSPA